MMKIKEGLGVAEKGSREKGEKEEKEKLASKAETVYAGNTEIAPPELIKNAQCRYSQCEGQLGIVGCVPF